MRVDHRLGAFCISFLTSLTLALSAHAALLPHTDGFGVFVFQDFTSHSTDTELNLAAGGHVDLYNYDVGSQVYPLANARIVAGGNVKFIGGEVGQKQGTIFAGGTIDTGGNTLTALNRFEMANPLPVDFSKAEAALKSISRELANRQTTGTTTSLYSTLTLSGTNAVENIFFISKEHWEHNNSVHINTPDGSINILNIAGQNIHFDKSGGQIFFNGVAGQINALSNSRTLYNLFEADTVTATGSKAPQGTLLAAYADVQGNWGQVNGQFIANSFDGNLQFNGPTFQGYLATPLPAALPMLATGLLGLAWYRRRAGKERSQMLSQGNSHSRRPAIR